MLPSATCLHQLIWFLSVSIVLVLLEFVMYFSIYFYVITYNVTALIKYSLLKRTRRIICIQYDHMGCRTQGQQAYLSGQCEAVVDMVPGLRSTVHWWDEARPRWWSLERKPAAFLQATWVSLGGVSCFSAWWPTNNVVLSSVLISLPGVFICGFSQFVCDLNGNKLLFFGIKLLINFGAI